MSAGKMAAQVAHGAEKAVMVMKFNSLISWDQRLKDRFMWMKSGNAKIVVAGKDAEHLSLIQADAREMGVPSCLIRDAGRTELEPHTVTVLALGPTTATDINAVSGHLRPIKDWPHPQKKWKQKRRMVFSRQDYEEKLAKKLERQKKAAKGL